MNFKSWPETKFGIAAHAIIEQFICHHTWNNEKIRPIWRRERVNRLSLLKKLERDLELSGLESPDELQTDAMSQHATNTNADRTKPMCHHFKKRGQYRNQCCLLKKQRRQVENNQISSWKQKRWSQ